MSATLISTTPSHRPLGITYPGNATSDPEHDWALIGLHTLSYAGPFSLSKTQVDSPKGGPGRRVSWEVVNGPLEVAGVPRWMGISMRRNFTVQKEGGREVLWLGIVDGRVSVDLWFRKLG